MRPSSIHSRLLVALILFLGSTVSFADVSMTRQEAFARARQQAALGRRIFFDPAISASGRQSCAACHDPHFAFGPPNGRPVQLGGPALTTAGTRAVPSIRYLELVPPFMEIDPEPTNYVAAGAAGGLTWDGRVDRGRDQASIPLLTANEMANVTPEALAIRVRGRPYAGELRQLFGPTVLDDAKATLTAVGTALEAYEQDERDFYPFTSKYDAVLAGHATLTPTEAHGLELFNDPSKGNCASCHPSTSGTAGTVPQFSDYRMFALGVPRNPEIPANADPGYFDLGLCGRPEFKDRAEYCGLFRTPTLRNVALRQSFFHNGAIHHLRDVVSFYATRDTDPAKWYPRGADGGVQKFNDMPAQNRADVEMGAPFGHKPGELPALSDAEIDDVVAFLNTLTDGYALAR